MNISALKKSSLLIGMGHFHKLWCEEMIFPLRTFVPQSIFFPEGSENIISSHKSLWKCNSHINKGFLMEKYLFIPSRPEYFIYFMQIPAFYLFCRKSSNIFEKNQQTRSSVENLFRKSSPILTPPIFRIRRG